MHAMTDAEVLAADERRRVLYTSDYVVDLLTAILMTPDSGSLPEVGARQKAARVLYNLGLDELARVNRDRTRTEQCAVARGVLA